MSKSERASKAETAFKLFDKNRDGFITREEFTQVRCPTQTWFVTKILLILLFQTTGVEEVEQGSDRGGVCQV